MQRQNHGIAWNQISVDYVVPVLIVLGSAIILFVRTAPIGASPESDTYSTFYSLTAGLENYYDFKTAWKSRLFSNGLAAITTYLSDWLLAKTSFPIVRSSGELTVALWTASWFTLICSPLIWFFKRRSVFYIFGTLAALSFGYLNRLHMAVRVYPWDLTALFFFTLFLVFFVQKKYWWIFALIPLSVGFKETSLILCAVFLLSDLPWKQRLGMFIGSLVLAAVVKISIDYFVHAPLFFTMETRVDGESTGTFYLWTNIYNLKDVLPFFINAGTLLAFLLLPNADRNIAVLKMVAILFISGNMFFGNMIEYRIWFEMIPFALYAMDVNIYGDPLNAEASS